MATTAMATVIQRLDGLDGIKDGHYTDLPLIGQNSTGACQLAEHYAEGASASGLPVQSHVTLRTVDRRRITIDCKGLAKRLNTLINIADRLPSFRFIADFAGGASAGQLQAPGRENLYGYHIVDHMISSLLLGLATSEQSFSKLFGQIPYRLYTGSVEELAGMIPNMEPGDLNVENADQAYDLFERLGTAYDFDTEPFRP